MTYVSLDVVPAVSGVGGGEASRSVKPRLAGPHVEGMTMMSAGPTAQSGGDDGDRISFQRDHESAEDTDLALNVLILGRTDRRIRQRNGRTQGSLQRGRAGMDGVEAVDGVAHRDRLDGVTNALPGKVHLGDVDRLGEDLAIYRQLEQLLEAAGVHAFRVQLRFVEVRAGAVLVIVMGKHGDAHESSRVVYP